MYTVEKLKIRNAELRDDIRESLEQYVASTGCLPTVEIDWHTSIGSSPRPVVYVTTVIK